MIVFFLAFVVGLTIDSLAFAVGLTLLRARPFANASAKRDINAHQRSGTSFANALANANARHSPCLPCSQERQTHHSGHTSHYYPLQGTSGCANGSVRKRNGT